MLYTLSFAVFLHFVALVSADSLKDIKHVVLFLQENRAFDHVMNHLSCNVSSALILCSTSGPWLAFAVSPIPMFKLTLTAKRPFNSSFLEFSS